MEYEKECFERVHVIAKQAVGEMNNCSYDVRALVDDFEKMSIQAVRLTQNVRLLGNTREVSFVVTAPHNVPGVANRAHSAEQVEGAGCALIEDAVYQVLSRMETTADSTPEDTMQSVRIVVQHTATSRSYYEHIYFEPFDNMLFLFNAQLTGENILHFLAQYGGRAKEAPKVEESK